MSLPDKPLFIAPNKVQDYLLNPDHPIGGAKARFFIGIGYSREHYQQLIADLIQHGYSGTVTEENPSPYGAKFVVDGPLLAPNGRAISTPNRVDGTIPWYLRFANHRSFT